MLGFIAEVPFKPTLFLHQKPAQSVTLTPLKQKRPNVRIQSISWIVMKIHYCKAPPDSTKIFLLALRGFRCCRGVCRAPAPGPKSALLPSPARSSRGKALGSSGDVTPFFPSHLLVRMVALEKQGDKRPEDNTIHLAKHCGKVCWREKPFSDSPLRCLKRAKRRCSVRF